MKMQKAFFFALMAGGAATVALAQSAANGIVGVASNVVASVTLSNTAIPQPRPVALRQRIALGDRIATGANSRLQILLLDRSSFSVGANARLVIDRFVYNPASGRNVAATAAQGALRFMSGRTDARSRATITSPVATIGIRGTVLDAVIGSSAAEIAEKEPFLAKRAKSDKDTATLIVLRGPTDVAPTLTPGVAEITAAGRTVVVDAPSLAAYVPSPGQPPIGPFHISPEGLERVMELTTPQMLGGKKRKLPNLPLFNIGIGIGGGRRSTGTSSPPQPSGPIGP